VNKFVAGIIVGVVGLVAGVVLAQSLQQTVPVPVPTAMGGTGNATGPQAVKTSVGTLPTCNASAEGLIFGVTDALTPAALSVVVGGGAVHVSVYCNGSSWIVL